MALELKKERKFGNFEENEKVSYKNITANLKNLYSIWGNNILVYIQLWDIFEPAHKIFTTHFYDDFRFIPIDQVVALYLTKIAGNDDDTHKVKLNTRGAYNSCCIQTFTVDMEKKLSIKTQSYL